MGHHFIHYIPRRVVTRFPMNANHPWFSEYHNLADGYFKPKYHISRRLTGPTQAIQVGDTIWLIGKIFTQWGDLPAGVDAKIIVDKIERQENGALRFEASDSSTWFPLADCNHVLLNLKTIDSSGRIRNLQDNPNIPFGQSLQSIRCLADANALEAWVEELNKRCLNFISYRICDGTHAAVIKIQHLLQEGEAVFWDRWSLPRRLAERREVVDDQAINLLVMNHLRNSKVVWGIETKKYSAPGSYSTKEQNEAIRLQIYKTA